MQGNEFSKIVLLVNAISWLKKLQQTIVIKKYVCGSIESYVNEMTLLCNYNHIK